jgi:membrane protease YdiL (CAAX protease family)
MAVHYSPVFLSTLNLFTFEISLAILVRMISWEYHCHGRWWIGIYYFLVLLVANVGGEEFWWRGYLLPRQKLSHGAAAWLVHGSLWALFHLFFQWTLQDLTHMLPTCCALAFVAQHRKNTRTGIIAHTFGSSALLLQIFRGIFGSE